MTKANLGGSFTLANTSLTVNRMGYGSMQRGTAARPGRSRQGRIHALSPRHCNFLPKRSPTWI